MDVIDRTKDDESKRFKGHKIDFDFSILLKIKEATVDLSSNCIELALKVFSRYIFAAYVILFCFVLVKQIKSNQTHTSSDLEAKVAARL